MKLGVTIGFQVLLLHVLFKVVFADGSNNMGRWGMTSQMLLLHVLPHFAAGGSECTQAQMVSILGRCPFFCILLIAPDLS